MDERAGFKSEEGGKEGQIQMLALTDVLSDVLSCSLCLPAMPPSLASAHFDKKILSSYALGICAQIFGFQCCQKCKNATIKP